MIFTYLFEFYKCNINKNNHFSLKSENEIKKYMQDWFNENNEFLGMFSCNFEPRSQDTMQTGFDDIKFQSQFWGRGRKYFVIECKILNESKVSTDKYLFREESKTVKGKISRYNDGGLYRFLINKYAANQEFGGMIGFVQKGNIERIMARLKEAIKNLELTSDSGKEYGKITGDGLLNQTVISQKNTFQSQHVRWDKDTDSIISPIHIYHIFFDFT